MDELLKINNVIFPEIEGGYDISYEDKTNEYESESGETTVEVIRQKVCNISVKYNGLLESKLKELVSAIHVVNTVVYYNPTTGTVETKTMKADSNRINISKEYYKNGLSVWSLSFSLGEM